MDLLVQILLFFVLGLALYWADAAVGVGLYRGWYGMTHRDPLPEGVRRGFLLGRPARVRLAWALGLAAVLALLTIRYGSFFQDSTRVVLNLLALLVGLGAGLLAAPTVLARLPGVVDRAADYVDAVDAGERRPGEDLRRAGGRAAEALRDAATGKAGPAAPKDRGGKASAPPPADDAPAEADPPAAADPPAEDAPPSAGDPDWRRGVDDFLNKR
jgi:hypothetical protein